MNVLRVNREARIISVCCVCGHTASTDRLVEKLKAQGWGVSHGLCRIHQASMLHEIREAGARHMLHLGATVRL